MKNIIHITQTDLLTGAYPELAEIFSVTDEDRERGSIQDMYIDCDHVKLCGEPGRGSQQFVEYEHGENWYIIWRHEPDPGATEIFEWWAAGADGAAQIENTWADWDKVSTGVAYRGGSGYCYRLTAKKMISQKAA